VKPFSKRLNTFIDEWFEQNKDKFTVYEESQFDFIDIDSTFKRFKDHYSEFKTIPMWFDDNADNIFADTSINAKFRAWHDYSHILVDADFSLSGEIETYHYQQSLLPLDWEFERKLMYCEIVEQAKHYSSGGETIKNQREFTQKILGTISTEQFLKFV